MPSGTFDATTTPPPLTVNQFYSRVPNTPGNVGVCLSGGGSRALTAGMGQLRALSYLGLLSQVKAISTVSGGSWLGVPFEFLPSGGTPDTDYLGAYVTDPGSVTVSQLQDLPAGNAGVPLTSDLFTPECLALEAYVLWGLGVPENMLWQTLIGLHILYPQSLFAPNVAVSPTEMFSYDQTTLGQITASNPALQGETAYLFADTQDSSRTRRPYLICNMGMFMNPGSEIQPLAPVQSTAFTTGIFGAPAGKDPNGLTPGGGGVTSFAFNSIFASATGAAVTASQDRQWSLTDAVGTSSAFFADKVANQLGEWEKDLDCFWDAWWRNFENIIKWIEKHLPLEAQARAKAVAGSLAVKSKASLDAGVEFPIIDKIVPLYQYWPVGEDSPTLNALPSQFADGGSLENTGVCGMLAYSDIDSMISFINTEAPLTQATIQVPNSNTTQTVVVVDDAVPPLFGYQPFDATYGYVPYAGASNPSGPQFANNQIFAESEFQALLDGLWNASGGGVNPAVFTQTLAVLPNTWFGIAARPAMSFVWCSLNNASSWVGLFSPDVQAAIASEVQGSSFPNYNTLRTSLTAQEINLMSMLAAWSVVSTDQASSTFSGLFKGTAAAAGQS